MRKKTLNEMLKKIKRNKEIEKIRFNPTLEECDYLYSKDVTVIKDSFKMTGICGGTYTVDGTSYYLER